MTEIAIVRYPMSDMKQPIRAVFLAVFAVPAVVNSRFSK